jgi:hypothetical protein
MKTFLALLLVVQVPILLVADLVFHLTGFWLNVIGWGIVVGFLGWFVAARHKRTVRD